MNRDILNAALEQELKDLWHNATLHSNIRVDDEKLAEYVDWRLNEYNQDMIRLMNAGECMPSAITDLIAEYGELYQYGRSSATLAPEKLIDRHDWVKTEIIDDLNAEKKTDLLYNLRHFNQYVRNHCSAKSQDSIIADILQERLGELQDENKELKAELAALKPELRAQRLQPTICEIVREKIRNIFADFQTNMNEIILIKETIEE